VPVTIHASGVGPAKRRACRSQDAARSGHSTVASTSPGHAAAIRAALARDTASAAEPITTPAGHGRSSLTSRSTVSISAAVQRAGTESGTKTRGSGVMSSAPLVTG
jgi:hypothetical protein